MKPETCRPQRAESEAVILGTIVAISSSNRFACDQLVILLFLVAYLLGKCNAL